MNLHVPTLFQVIIAATLVLACAIAYIAQDRHRDLRLWALALALQAAAHVLLGLRSLIPDLLSVVVANMALSASLAVYAEGVLRFQQRESTRLIWLPVVFVGISFHLLRDNFEARLLLSSVVLMLQSFFVAALLLQRRRQTPGRGQNILLAGAVLAGALLALRLLATLSGAIETRSLMEANAIQGSTFLASLLATLLLSMGILVMTQERAEHALVETRRFQAFRTRILELLSRGEPLPGLLTSIVQGIERLHPDMRCSIHLLDRQGEDVGPRRSAGPAACWSQPIRSGDQQVIGTLSIYRHEAGAPMPADSGLLEQSALLAGLAIERGRAADELKESERHYRQLVEASNEGICIVQDAEMRFVNPKMREILGFSDHDLIGHGFLRFIHPDDANLALENHHKRLAGQGDDLKYALRIVTRGGAVRWVDISGRRIDWQGRPATLNFITDVTEQRLKDEQIRELAYHDTLTRLPNRRLFLEHLQQALAANKRSGKHSAVLFMDLDNFKPLNDAHGHAVGDLLLIDVAHRIRTCLREMDTVARFGGDEFVALLTALSADRSTAEAQVRRVAEKILQTLAGPYRLTTDCDGRSRTIEHRCTASIGITLFASEATGADALLDQADAAMYQAKHAGRNRLQFARRPELMPLAAPPH